jgi:hypothetical protein
MSGALKAAELFDIDRDQFARAFPLVAPHRLGRLQRRDAVRPSRRNTRLTGAFEMARSRAIC